LWARSACYDWHVCGAHEGIVRVAALQTGRGACARGRESSSVVQASGAPIPHVAWRGVLLGV